MIFVIAHKIIFRRFFPRDEWNSNTKAFILFLPPFSSPFLLSRAFSFLFLYFRAIAYLCARHRMITSRRPNDIQKNKTATRSYVKEKRYVIGEVKERHSQNIIISWASTVLLSYNGIVVEQESYKKSITTKERFENKQTNRTKQSRSKQKQNKKTL